MCVRPFRPPYLDMTIDTARRFGVEIMHQCDDYTEFYIEGGQRFTPADYRIECDWSAAAIMMIAGAIAGEVVIRNISMCRSRPTRPYAGRWNVPAHRSSWSRTA